MAPSARTSTASRTKSQVRWLMRICPGLALDSSRAARFTLSPITVYSIRSAVPTVPATASPALTPIPLLVEPDDPRPHGEGRLDGPRRMIRMGDRRPEDGHHGVPHELVERAVVLEG